MFFSQPLHRSTAAPDPRRARLRAVAVLTAAIAIIGGVIPTVAAHAAGTATLIVTVDPTSARFPTVTVTTSDGSVLPAVKITTHSVSVLDTEVTCTPDTIDTCAKRISLPNGGSWTFTAAAPTFADVTSAAVTIENWAPTSTKNHDDSLTMMFPSPGGTPSYFYSLVSPGHPVLSAHSSSSSITLAASAFVAGATYTAVLGYDILDAGSTITGPREPMPDFVGGMAPPTGLIVTPGDSEIDVSWIAPAGSSPDPSWRYAVYVAYGGTTTPSGGVSSSSLSMNLPLDNGVEVEIWLRASSADGAFYYAESEHIFVTPMRLPATPTSVAVTPSDRTGFVSAVLLSTVVSPSLAKDAIWEIRQGINMFVPATMDFTTSPISVTGLTNGLNYVLRVRAKNAAGQSAGVALSGTFMPGIAPAVPSVSRETTGNGSLGVTATFTSPTTPALSQVWEISTFTASTADAWVAVTPIAGANNTFAFPGLINGREYRVRVKSTSGIAGTGVSSPFAQSQSVFPFGAAAVPTITSVGRGNATVSATASFNASLAQPSDPNDAIWQLSTADGATISGTDLTMTALDDRFVFSRLTNGDAYQIRVQGSNAHGASDWSAWSDPISPASAPLALVLTPGGMANGGLTVTFPVATAAAPVTSIAWQVGEVKPDGSVTWTDAVPTIDGTTATFTGLTPGTKYEFKATPSNDVGEGPESSSAAQLVIGVPAKPVIEIAGAQKAGLLVGFEAVAANEANPTLGYVWEVAPLVGPDAGIWKPVTATKLDQFTIDTDGEQATVLGGYAITGLIDGVRYSMHVAGINGAGQGPWAAWIPVLTPSSSLITGTIPAADNTAVAGVDGDGDGMPNATDSDVDGDGIPNPYDADVDGDGLPNAGDGDSDNDGIDNVADSTPNGIGSLLDHADDWIEPAIIPTTSPLATTSTTKTSATTSNTATSATKTQQQNLSENESGADSPSLATELSIRLPYPFGQKVGGMVVYSSGHGLLPGSKYSLELHSKSISLARGSVGSDGVIDFTATMPTSVAPGKHELVLTAVSAAGKTVTKTLALRVGAHGQLIKMDSSSSPSRSGTVLEAASTQDDVLRTALIVAAAILLLLILAGAFWLAWILRHRRKDDDDELDDDDDPNDESPDLLDNEVEFRR
ncbi:hypothetical protein BH09ACT1_BH09ACT1_00790 [soil metagenome]